MFNKTFLYLEELSAKLQGKGWGGRSTVAKEFSAAVALLSRNDIKVCVDIGGNKGTYTDEIIRKFPNSKVVIFEPAAVNIEELQEKFSSNDNISIMPFGVSSKSGPTTLYSNEDGSGLASLTKRNLKHLDIDFENTEAIRTVNFESFWRSDMDSEHIDFCKIDIEGHELDALLGFGEAINNIDLIQFEFGGCNIDTNVFFRELWNFFVERNFDIFRITPFGAEKLNKYRETDEFFSTTNYLAKRRI